MPSPDFYKMVYTEYHPEDPWNKFWQTRDWYDIPESIRSNDWIYQDAEAIQRRNYRERPGRFYIYPKDVEFMYDYTPDTARSLLNDVREYLGLSVSGPVTCYDLQKHTRLDLQTILDFIMES